MRCPKCGYISFDHIDICLKCNKDVSKVAKKVEGTTYNVAAPSFLKFTSSNTDQIEETSEISFDGTSDEYDVVDPDLDVLADDLEIETEDTSDASISFGDEFEGFDSLTEDDDFEISSGDDETIDNDAGIDLAQFEDAFEEQEAAPADDDIMLDLPDELADISDLEAPSDEPEPMPEELPEPAGEKDEIGDFSLDLDLDELGDDFSLTEKPTTAEGTEEMELGDLSLDDLGLAEEEKEVSVETESGDMNMDADLDFDLDLGGISLDKEK